MEFLVTALLSIIIYKILWEKNYRASLIYHKERGDYWSSRYEQLLEQLDDELDRDWWENWAADDEQFNE